MKSTPYLLQAALVSLWWVALAASPRFFAAFQFVGIPPVAFWAFLGPDLFLIAGLSVVRAYHPRTALEFVLLGAFGYATLYCVHATLLTGSGHLSTTLMLLGLAYNGFLCFNRALFRSSASTRTRNLLKTLVQIACIWTLTLGVIPYVILDAFGAWTPPRVDLRLFLGGALFLGFSVLGLASAWVMVRDGRGTPLPLDQTNALVMAGPYRFVRNPMAVAGIGQGLAIAWAFQSVPLLVYALLGAGIWHGVVRPSEERDLARRFGSAYLDYRRDVRCWLPGRRPGN
jgi:protein-S-isoprenylcysteine O-methyltransferase Ste14